MNKKTIKVAISILLVLMFAFFALASGSEETKDQGKDSTVATESNSNIGKYQVEIKECRLAKDFEGKDIAIVKCAFTNNSDDPISFGGAFLDKAYQNGVELEKAYFVDESADYNSDEQYKDIKKGVKLDVEVAYILNDTTSDIEVEVEEFISFNNTVIKKTFSIS